MPENPSDRGDGDAVGAKTPPELNSVGSEPTATWESGRPLEPDNDTSQVLRTDRFCRPKSPKTPNRPGQSQTRSGISKVLSENNVPEKTALNPPPDLLSTGDVKKTTDHAHGNSIPPSENPTVIAESITPDDSIMLPSSEENTPIAIPPNTKNPKLLKKWYRKLLETIEPPEPEATISSYGIKKLTEILGGNETHILNALITRCEDIRKSGKQITCVLHEPCTRELKLVRKLKRLNILSIRGNIRCPNLLEVLKEHPNISELEISEEGKRISNIGLNIKDDDLRHLESFPKLQKLILNNCLVLSDEGMKHLSQLNLTRLELSGCLKTAKTPGITGSGLANLHPSLQHLQLADNPITDENLHHLAHLTNLEFLGLSGCTEITGTDFGWLENMTQLKRLQLRTHQTR